MLPQNINLAIGDVYFSRCFEVLHPLETSHIPRSNNWVGDIWVSASKDMDCSESSLPADRACPSPLRANILPSYKKM